jgi:hypothetical protein
VIPFFVITVSHSRPKRDSVGEKVSGLKISNLFIRIVVNPRELRESEREEEIEREKIKKKK